MDLLSSSYSVLKPMNLACLSDYLDLRSPLTVLATFYSFQYIGMHLTMMKKPTDLILLDSTVNGITFLPVFPYVIVRA